MCALYVVQGDETLLVQEACDAIRSAAQTLGYSERSVFTTGAHFDWGQVVAACSSLSLFCEKQIVELRLPTGKPGKDGSQILQQLAASAPSMDGSLLLITLPRLDKTTRNSAWFAALESAGVSIQCEPVDRRMLPGWLAQRLQLNGQRVQNGATGQATLQFFADRVEGNLLAAHQEVQKLALLYPAGELSFTQVEQAVLDVARYDVFKLSEALLAGQLVRAQKMLDGLQAEGVAEVLVHWAIAEDIRALTRVRQALDTGRPLPVALREQRIWGLKEKLFERALPRLSQPTLARLLDAAHHVDGIVKGMPKVGWPTQGWMALQELARQLGVACGHTNKAS